MKTAACNGCDADVIAIADDHWRVVVHGPSGQVTGEQVFCLPCMTKLALLGVKLLPFEFRPGAEHGRREPSAIDCRRLRDGARALEVSRRPADSIDEVRKQLALVGDGIAALQSLDDLGPEANERAAQDEQELWKRLHALTQQLKDLEEAATKT